jgi:hypothetical protein
MKVLWMIHDWYDLTMNKWKRLSKTYLVPHGINKPFHHHIECLINSGPFGYKCKVGDTPGVDKADQHCSFLGLSHGLFGLGKSSTPVKGLLVFYLVIYAV